MATIWTINDETFSARGLGNVTRQLYNMATDRMTFTAPGRAIDAAAVFAYDQDVTVQRDGAPFFRGRAGRTPVMGSSESEDHAYEILGPWDQLERLTFQQRWKTGSWVDDEWVPRWEYKSRVILGLDEAGVACSIGAVISEVIFYARDCGVSIAVGTIDEGGYAPWDEVVDMSCADVLRRMARWSPDSVGWIDYSVAIPAFNWRRRASLPPSTLTIGTQVSSASLTQIGARAVPAVVLKYEETSTVNGSPMEVMTVDAWPVGATGREIGSVVQTIQLAGGRLQAQTQRQQIRSRQLPAMSGSNPALVAWFLEKFPTYAAPANPAVFDPVRHHGATITAVGRKSTLPYELMEGSLQDWMRKKLPTYPSSGPFAGTVVWSDNPSNKYSFEDAEDVITFTLSYTVNDNSGSPLRSVTDEKVTAAITVVDCESGRYSRLTNDVSGGETVPVGLARSLYEALNAVHYQGTVDTVASEITGDLNIGFRLLLAGGNPAWASMSAVIQSITNNLDTGMTTIQVGPPDHLTPGQVLDLRRANRARKPSSGSGVRISGETGDGNSVDLASAQPKNNAVHGPGRWGERQTFITAVRFDASTNCIQVKKQTAVVDYADGETGWEAIEGGCAEDCSSGNA